MPGGPTPLDLIFSFLPLIILVGLVILIVVRLSGRNSYAARNHEEIRKQNTILERIAAALEKRN